MNEHRLGALLLENPLMREEDLQRCLQIQELTGNKPLGEILVEEGLLTHEALEQLLQLQAARRQSTEFVQPVDGNDVDQLIAKAISAGAEELILSAGRCVTVRIAGQLQPFTQDAIDDARVERFLKTHLGPGIADRLEDETQLSTDFTLLGVARGRIVAFRHSGGLAAVVRLHREASRTLAEAGMSEVVGHMLDDTQGLVLVAGERRSGVTETLGALLTHAAKKEGRLIMVLDHELEYASEYPVTLGESLVVRRRVGQHTRDYSAGVRAAISQGADVLVVGNASDPEVFDVCLRAAASGRLVVAAVRAKSVASALARSLSSYSKDDLSRVRTTLGAVIKCIVAVQLLPDTERRELVMATELLVADEVVRGVLREGMLPQLDLLMRLEGSGVGHAMDHSLLSLLRAGKIAFQDAFSRATDKNQVLAVSRGEG